jgi:hypothetical protein
MEYTGIEWRCRFLAKSRFPSLRAIDFYRAAMPRQRGLIIHFSVGCMRMSPIPQSRRAAGVSPTFQKAFSHSPGRQADILFFAKQTHFRANGHGALPPATPIVIPDFLEPPMIETYGR